MDPNSCPEPVKEIIHNIKVGEILEDDYWLKYHYFFIYYPICHMSFLYIYLIR